jgi:peptide/nickel transport system substrate-binding protein
MRNHQNIANNTVDPTKNSKEQKFLGALKNLTRWQWMQTKLMNWTQIKALQRHMVWFALGTWLFVALLGGCSSLGNGTANRSRGINTPLSLTVPNPSRIVIGTTSKVRTLDPADADGFFAANILYNVTESLYSYKPGTTELIPKLASDFPTVSEDGLSYTIPLRSGVKFHDRTDFNAHTMKFALERFITAKGAPSYLLADVIDSISVPEPMQLGIRLKKPLPAFPRVLAFTGAAAISPHVYKRVKDPKTGQLLFVPDQIIGTGPYQLTQYQDGSYLRLDAFPDYWGKKPVNRGVDIQFFSSASNLINAFKTKAIDLAFQTPTPLQIRNLQNNAAENGWSVVTGKGPTILYMSLNTRQAPLNDVRVRQALAAAVDRPLLKERVFLGQREPVYSLLPATFGSYKPAFQEKYGDANGKIARQLLQEAGYSDDNPVQLSIWYTPKYGGNGDLVVSTLKASLERTMGKIARIKTERVENSVGYSFLERGAYPIYLLDWVPDILDADNFLSPFLDCAEPKGNTCEKGQSQYQGSFYYNEELQTLLNRQKAEKDGDERRKLVFQIQDLVARDVPFIPLWQNKEYIFVQKGLQGVSLEPSQQLTYSNIQKDSPGSSG